MSVVYLVGENLVLDGEESGMSVVRLLVALSCVALAVTAFAGELEEDSPTGSPSSATTAKPEQPPAEDAQQQPTEPSEEQPLDAEHDDDPCSPYKLSNYAWIDRLQRRVYTSVCGSALWFDRFFGDDRAYDEAESTGGRVSLRLLWSEYDRLDPRLRFRANVALPNLNNRLHAFLGRLNEDEYVSDSGEDENQPIFTDREYDDDDWLVGLGYYPLRARRQRFKISAGVRVSFPVDPYVKTQYRYYHPMTENLMFRFRQTVFWRAQERFGTTSNLDLEQRLGDRFLLRWANSGTLSELSEGVEWWSSITLYQELRSLRRRAIAYKVWWQGESDAPVTVRDCGLRVVYRQSVWREWLFGELGAGVNWPREHVWERRDKSWGALIGVEMHFGHFP